MDYEKKYKEALEKARQLCAYPTTKPFISDLQDVFPELKEDKDEKIRKELLEHCKNQAKPYIYTGNKCPQIQSWIDWLEKQCETFTKKDVDDAYLKGVYDTKQELEKQGENTYNEELSELLHEVICRYITNPDIPYLERENVSRKIIRYVELLEKQGENHIVDNNEMVKPIDKVEPKFKVGKWYQCTKDFFGKGVTFDKNTAYYCAEEGCLQNEYGCHVAIVKELYDNFKLWTIQDARDGDILVSPATQEDKECPFIFKEIGKDGIVRFHVALLQSEEFKIADGITNVMGYANAGYHVPATKEQRDNLLKAMADAGYTFDFGKKELKKIEQKPAWNEEYENHIIDITQTIGGAIKHNVISHKTGDMQITWLKSIKDRVWPKQEWSEEDEQMLRRCISVTFMHGYLKEHNWLKSLYDMVQSRQEWSKEDKECLDGVIDSLQRYNYNVPSKAVDEQILWLKSLRPKNRWRPSERQMKQLGWIAKQNKDNMIGKELMTLYNDLKQLK